MDTLKTAIVVVLLLAVLYGVYVTLNQPDQDIPKEIAWAVQQSDQPLNLEFDDKTGSASTRVTASLGDSTPRNHDSVAGDTHVHDKTTAAPYVSANSALPAYGDPSKPLAAAIDVAAPDLITSTPGEPYGSAGSSGDFDGAATYDPNTTPSTTQSLEASGSPDGLDSSNYYGSNQTTGTTPVPPSPLGSRDSAYGSSEQYGGVPEGSYDTVSALSNNLPVTATAAPTVADSYAKSPTSPSTISPTDASRIKRVIATARNHIDQDQYYEALLALSLSYDSLGISEQDRQQLLTWLDPLAGRVIYSKEHLVGPAYTVQAGETLESVAAKHKVTWQLLANINGLRDPTVVQSGMSIKVVPGPFRAEIDIAKNSLTLFMGRLYAGKFAITVNSSNPPASGDYTVNDKQPGHSFYAGNAQTLSPQDPNNPFGGIWIDLGGNVSIHGTSSSPGQSKQLGCVALNPKDANDLYGILSLGSNVVIRR